MGARQADADSLAEIASKALFFHIASGSEVNHAESPTTNISYRGTYCSLRFFNSGTRARSTLALRTTVEVIGRSLTDRGAELIRLVDIKVPPSKPSSEVKQGLPWDVEADGWFARKFSSHPDHVWMSQRLFSMIQSVPNLNNAM